MHLVISRFISNPEKPHWDTV